MPTESKTMYAFQKYLLQQLASSRWRLMDVGVRLNVDGFFFLLIWVSLNPIDLQVETSKGILLKGKPGHKGMAGKVPRSLLPFVDMSKEKQ